MHNAPTAGFGYMRAGWNPYHVLHVYAVRTDRPGEILAGRLLEPLKRTLERVERVQG